MKKLDAQRDEDIDYSEIPEFSDEFLRKTPMEFSPGKTAISLRMDDDLLEWLRSQGKGYQTRINAIVRAYYEQKTAQ